MFRKIAIMFAIVFFQAALLIPPAAAQATDNGNLSGTVTDPNGAIVPGAVVTVTNLATGLKRSVTAGASGTWTVSVLPLGNYEVKAESAGFDPVTKPVAVAASVTTTVDLQLGLQLQGEQVDVVATETNGTIRSDSPVTGSQITGRRLESLPVANRSSFGVLAIDPSVSTDLTDPLSNGNGNPEVSVNGSRTTSQALVFNGIDATNFSGTGSLTENVSPSPETVEEVKVLSSLYDASLGRSGGGNIQLVTKRGGNEFTGSAYAYVQNEAFNANDFFFNRDGIDRQKARRFEGGVTVGGPIKRDRLWFFGSYQRTDASTAYVPSAQSFVVLPEALARITDRSNPENVRLAFVAAQQQGGAFSSFRNGPSCINVLSPTSFPGLITSTCIDPTSPGFRLLSTVNPATGGFMIPNLIQGRYEPLFYSGSNVQVLLGGVTRITDFSAYGLPNGLPILDRNAQGRVSGGTPLVRVRNVFPADFEQDQFTTRLDYLLSPGGSDGSGLNQLEGTFFFANFPATDPFSDDTLVSPVPLIKDDQNRTLAIKDTHFFSATLINEVRFGFFTLDNSRRLDDRFLADGLTNASLGIANPASLFEPGAASQRAARFAGRANFADFSLNAPNDVFNKRKQLTFTLADNVTYTWGNHSLKFGGEHKRNFYDTSLPEEQGIEFEGLSNFTELLTGFVPEADVAFGATEKQFRFNDLSFYISDDWKLHPRLTLNVGVRWDWFGWPIEKMGRFSNFDFDRVSNPDDIRPGFILPKNTETTGFSAIDDSLPGIASVDSRHTLNGQDLDNFAPRIGFAWKPFANDRTLIRGGYGIFFDRPSAAFINTIYSNFPFFREIEKKTEFVPATVQGTTAFANEDPRFPFINYFPFGVSGRTVARFTPYVLIDSSPGGSSSVSGAEPLEFRAIDRDLQTPMIQQWNLGIQQEFGSDWTIEARYLGTRGQHLLLAVGFNQPYDLNDPNTPDYIYARLNQACLLTPGCTVPAPSPGVSERDRGASTSASDLRAFGACNGAFAGVAGYTPCTGGGLGATGGIDLNAGSNAGFVITDALISADVRVPYLGFDPTDAIILQSRGYSFYHSGQLTVSRRLSKGVGFSASYTFSKSIDIGSTDPGSTTASGRPDTPNLGLVVQGDQRNLDANRAVSDFDRPHRFSGSFAWEVPTFGSKSRFLTGWQVSGFGQWQSGSPFSIFATNAGFEVLRTSGDIASQFLGIFREASERLVPFGSLNVAANIFNVGGASGTIFNAAFGRPNVRSLALLRRQGSDITREYFNTCQDPTNPSECALYAPLGGFGNLGRNTLRGPSQKRIDFSIQKSTRLTERMQLELKWDIFNAFNMVNFANPNSDLSDETDFGQITRTVGAPRVMQFGAKLRF
ncbi:MAG: carboxypeptidase regulatory-like domain-containing protein [Pyrinomonadaceae bacterium]